MRHVQRPGAKLISPLVHSSAAHTFVDCRSDSRRASVPVAVELENAVGTCVYTFDTKLAEP